MNTFHGGKDITNVIDLKILRQKDYPGLYRGGQIFNLTGPYMGKRRIGVKEGNGAMKTDVRERERVMLSCWFQNKERSGESRNAGSL